MLTLLALLACTPPADTGDTGADHTLVAGTSRQRLEVPVGVGTMGFLAHGVSPHPSPFTSQYPATTTIHGHPMARVLVLAHGQDIDLALVLTDTYTVHQQAREAMVQRIQEQTGQDLSSSLIWAATRTQSGPGGWMDSGPVLAELSDTYTPPVLEALVAAAADGVEEALDQAGPAQVGWGLTQVSGLRMDRRCQDGETETDATVPILAVRSQGELVAVVWRLGVHHTGIGIEELTLSTAGAGAAEAWVEDALGPDVLAMALNGASADMAPMMTPGEVRPDSTNQPSLHDEIEHWGRSMATPVLSALDELTWEEDPLVRVRTERVPLSREALGYPEEVFPWEHGAFQCDGPTDCDPDTESDGLDHHCLGLDDKHPAPSQVLLTAAQVGGMRLLTFPGSPSTSLAARLHAEADPQQPLVLVGDAQASLFYSLEEEDWWQGGKEASRSLWGPGQGDHLAQAGIEVLGRLEHGGESPWAHLEPLPAWEPAPSWPEGPCPAQRVGEILEGTGGTMPPHAEAWLEVAGADPRLGTPLATLVDTTGAPVLSPGGRPVNSDSLASRVELIPSPPWEQEADERLFRWRFAMPLRHEVEGALLPDLVGSYQLRVSLPLEGGGTQEVLGPVFEVVP